MRAMRSPRPTRRKAVGLCPVLTRCVWCYACAIGLCTALTPRMVLPDGTHAESVSVRYNGKIDFQGVSAFLEDLKKTVYGEGPGQYGARLARMLASTKGYGASRPVLRGMVLAGQY
eukprot:658054-Rhodomonas_salina.3